MIVGWRNLHNEEHHVTCYKNDNIKEDEFGGACSAHRGNEKLIQNLVGKTEEKRPLGKPRHSWYSNIKTYVRKRG
jgi:hypothetical protein